MQISLGLDCIIFWADLWLVFGRNFFCLYIFTCFPCVRWKKGIWTCLQLAILLCFSGIYVATSEHAFGYQDSSLLCRNLLLLSLGAVLAFMLEMAEFLVVSYASSLTLSVAGIFKVYCLLFLYYLLTEHETDSMDWLLFSPKVQSL